MENNKRVVKVLRRYCLDHIETRYHLAGQAFHTSYCHSCGKKMEFATTYDELLCIKCSNKYNQCAKCGRVITDKKSEALLALEKLDRLEKWLNRKEQSLKAFGHEAEWLDCINEIKKELKK